MSFTGPNPYGTAGGDEVIAAPQIPPMIRTGLGNSVILFLHVNGRLVERLRENVEDVVRILGLSGQVLVAIITREDSVVRDANTSDMDFQDAFSVTQIAPGVVSVEIKNDGISSAMLQDALIQAIHLAPFAVTNGAVADDAIDGRTIAALAVDNAHMADDSVDARVLAPGAVPASGLTLIERRDFPNGTSQSFNNVFSSTYDVYMVTGSISCVTVSFPVNFRLRVGGADISASNYRYWGDYLSMPAATPSHAVYGSGSVAQAFFLPGLAGGRWLPGAFQAFFHNPALAAQTDLYSNVHGVLAGLSWANFRNVARYEAATVADGFTIFSSSQFSGSVAIYGLQMTP